MTVEVVGTVRLLRRTDRNGGFGNAKDDKLPFRRFDASVSKPTNHDLQRSWYERPLVLQAAINLT